MRKETPEGAVGCVVPQHDLVDPGTLRGILRQARLSVEEFVAAL
jgi:predicted RNA binding protein YcfA (HicA-like mRNA interferase family)